MKTEEEIKKKIENLKQDIIQYALEGCFTDLRHDKCWFEALEWVLESEEE